MIDIKVVDKSVFKKFKTKKPQSKSKKFKLNAVKAWSKGSMSIPYSKFESIPDELKPTKEHIGERVVIAGEKRTVKYTLVDINDSGELKVKTKYGNVEHYFPESVALY